MRLVACSDLHLDEACLRALLEHGSDADLVLVAGDFAQRREGLADYMQRLEPISGKAIYIAGNNESWDELRAATSATVLHGTSVERMGYVVGGLGGGVPPLPAAPFASWDLTEEEADAALLSFEHVDILMTHSPPKGMLDRFDGRSIGSTAVRRAVERLQPTWLLCGHVHDCWGGRMQVGATMVANLGPVPVVVDLD